MSALTTQATAGAADEFTGPYVPFTRNARSQGACPFDGGRTVAAVFPRS